jgi:SAM-dependent methyltransferase
VIDVGGGDSRLADGLLTRGVTCITVLDVSGAALARARARLGPRSGLVNWIEADVTFDWIAPMADIWHDRAVFHFFTDADERRRYADRMRRALKPGGSAIIATFADDGPQRCSGLPVVRYSPDALSAELGAGFELRDAVREEHRTPSGGAQQFVYCRFVRTEAKSP